MNRFLDRSTSARKIDRHSSTFKVRVRRRVSSDFAKPSRFYLEDLLDSPKHSLPSLSLSRFFISFLCNERTFSLFNLLAPSHLIYSSSFLYIPLPFHSVEAILSVQVSLSSCRPMQHTCLSTFLSYQLSSIYCLPLPLPGYSNCKDERRANNFVHRGKLCREVSN